MDYKDIDFKFVRYKIASFQLVVGSNEPFRVDPQVISYMSLEKNFDEEIFPYFECTVLVPFWVYNNITADPKNVYVLLDLQCGFFDANAQTPVPMQSDIKGRYYCLLEEMTPDPEADMQLRIESQEGVVNERYGGNDQMPIQMLLYNAQYYEPTRTQTNAVLSSATPLGALTYVCSQAGIGNILMAPPENNGSYSEFKVTPVRVTEQIWRICNDYAIYKTGAIVFFDLDCCYILPKKPECTAYRPNEWTNTHAICIENFNETTTQMGGHYQESKEKINVLNIIKDSIMKSDVSNTTTNNFTLIDTANGSATTVSSATGSNAQSGGPTTTYMFDSGIDSSSIIANQLKEGSKGFACQFSHVMLSALAPNKLFVVTIDDPKLKDLCGKYRISKYVCQFEQEGNYWIPKVTAEFKCGG